MASTTQPDFIGTMTASKRMSREGEGQLVGNYRHSEQICHNYQYQYQDLPHAREGPENPI